MIFHQNRLKAHRPSTLAIMHLMRDSIRRTQPAMPPIWPGLKKTGKPWQANGIWPFNPCRQRATRTSEKPKPPPRADRTYLSFNAYSITNGNHIQTFTTDNGLFDAASVGDSGAYSGSVNLSFRGPKDWYYLNFLAPGGERLQRRTYNDAERYPFQTKGRAGLDFSGNGSGCNKLTGRFEIQEISYSSANQIDLIEATFERRCEGDTTIIYGRVRYDRRDQK